MIRILSYLIWPALLIGCLLMTELGIVIGHSILVFNLTYLALGIILWKLERLFPHEVSWQKSDGQAWPDLTHTLFNKGIVQAIVMVSTITGFVEVIGDSSIDIWPKQLPLFVQVILALAIMDFGLYWKHRIAHEWLPFWPYHAVHHSSLRLWFFNTGRFHIVDTLTGLMFSLPLLFLLGAPEIVFLWIVAITAYIGMLTHCNVEMRFGFLSLVFNTPELHRWHHSRRLRESNSNYGENITLWDHLFGTYFREARRPPASIGISHKIADDFLGQLKAPFMMSSKNFNVARQGSGPLSKYRIKRF